MIESTTGECRAMRVCTKCKDSQPIEEFGIDRQKVDGLTSQCRTCRLANGRAWYERHQDRVTENTSAWRAANPEKVKAQQAAWVKKNKSKVNAKNARRKARRLRATPLWANQFFIDEAYDLGRLRSEATGFRWHVDHIVPLCSPRVCGLHVENNLRVIPAVSNAVKSNLRWPDMAVEA